MADNDRYQGLRSLAAAAGLDAIALVPGVNLERLYEQRFMSHERPLLVLVPVEGPPAAIVPAFEVPHFEHLGFEGPVHAWRDQEGYQRAFTALLSSAGIKRLGVEAQTMRVFVRDALCQAQADLEIIDAHAEIGALRLCKSADEIARLRQAIALSEQALEQTLEQIRLGMSEKAVERLLRQHMLTLGGVELSFDPLVAFGANSAIPHPKAREHSALEAGQAMLFDFGIRHEGLCADITRTVFAVHADDEAQAVYEVVLAANRAGLAAAHPGAYAGDIDEAATAVLERSPFADRILHKTGHGLGREVHEPPWIMRGDRTVLQEDMVFTIEPGLYAQGRFGVRIEDDVRISADGAESMTTFARELRVLPLGSG